MAVIDFWRTIILLPLFAPGAATWQLPSDGSSLIQFSLTVETNDTEHFSNIGNSSTLGEALDSGSAVSQPLGMKWKSALGRRIWKDIRKLAEGIQKLERKNMTAELDTGLLPIVEETVAIPIVEELERKNITAVLDTVEEELEEDTANKTGLLPIVEETIAIPLVEELERKNITAVLDTVEEELEEDTVKHRHPRGPNHWSHYKPRSHQKGQGPHDAHSHHFGPLITTSPLPPDVEGPGHHQALQIMKRYQNSFWALGISILTSAATISIYCYCTVSRTQAQVMKDAKEAALGLAKVPKRKGSTSPARKGSLSPTRTQEKENPARSRALERGVGGGRGRGRMRGSPGESPSQSRDAVGTQVGSRRTMGVPRSHMPGTEMVRERAFSWHMVTFMENTWRPENDFETMSSFAFIVNCVADLVPSGFLSISYGMEGIGYIPTGILIAVIGLLGATTMWACGRSCEITGEYDFASQWAATIGPKTSWIPLGVIVIVSFGALLCYSCYFGDLLAEVMPAFDFPLPRAVCLIAVSLFPTLPLCFLKNLSALMYSSFAAFVAMIYVAIVMLMRASDGSYDQGGKFFEDVVTSHHPVGGNLWRMECSALTILNILAMAFHCHCNACKYYRELAKNAPNHFGKCTLGAMSICGLLYAIMGFSGFRTFGFNSSGTILQNYALSDWPINIARVLVSLSLISSYAIMFSALRESVIGLFRQASNEYASFERVWVQDVLSICLVALITIIAVFCDDSGLVDGFVGAIAGNAIVFIIPCILYVAAVRAHLDIRRNKYQLCFSYFLIALGVVFTILGLTCLVEFEIVVDVGDRLMKDSWAPNITDMSNRTIDNASMVDAAGELVDEYLKGAVKLSRPYWYVR